MTKSVLPSSRVVAVISAYNPPRDLIQNCKQLQPQVREVIVVDDGSIDANWILNELETAGVKVVRIGENLGIGHAMNVGFEIAQEFAPEFIVTFDQDSAVPQDFVEALIREHDRLSEGGLKLAMVAPEFFSTTRQTTGTLNARYLEAYAPIQSGLLMPVAAIKALGPQRSDYFIDLVDSEYFFRAHRAGYAAACVPGLTLPHAFGHRLYVHVFRHRLLKESGRPRMVAVSTPFRYYYRARNRVLMNREYANSKVFGRRLRRDARADLLLDFGVAIYSARGKYALVKLMLAGWRDGLFGRTGKIPDRLMRNARRVSWKHPVEDS